MFNMAPYQDTIHSASSPVLGERAFCLIAAVVALNILDILLFFSMESAVRDECLDQICCHAKFRSLTL